MHNYSGDIFKNLLTQIVALWDKENPLIQPPMHNSEDIFKNLSTQIVALWDKENPLDTPSNA